jgi:hypothetical protein
VDENEMLLRHSDLHRASLCNSLCAPWQLAIGERKPECHSGEQHLNEFSLLQRLTPRGLAGYFYTMTQNILLVVGSRMGKTV